MHKPIICKECGEFPDCPQLKDEVWYTIGAKDDLLCLKHAEDRLGRHIAPDDLAPCPANAYSLEYAKRSVR